MNIFLKYIISGIQKTFDYKGRAVRSEYWWFILFAFIYYFIFIFIFGGEAIENGAIFLLHNLIWLPAISLLVRRLHDVGRSGWWVLISLTGFGALFLLYWAVMKSSPDKNQWGNFPEEQNIGDAEQEMKSEMATGHQEKQQETEKTSQEKGSPQEESVTKTETKSQKKTKEKAIKKEGDKMENQKEVKYINYDQVEWVLPAGWENDAPYVDGKPFTGIVYEDYPNGVRSSEDEYIDGIRHGRQTKFYENGYVHWEKIYEYKKFVKWSVEINDTKNDEHKPPIVSETSTETKEENESSNSNVLCKTDDELDGDEDLELWYYPKGTKTLFTGKLVAHYENGQKQSEEGIVDGKNSGESLSWYENGQQKDKGNYVKGTLVGIRQRWYSNGQLEREENWTQDDSDLTGNKLLSRVMYNEDGSIKKKYPEEVDTQEESSNSDVSEETPTEPAESSGDPVEDFRSFLASNYPNLKLPKGKKYVEFPIGKGMLVCCMVKTNGVNVYLYSGGKVPAREVFNKLNELGVSGKVINDKYTITPMPGSRNPNVVRIDLEIPYDGRELNSPEMREEVNDVYSQLLELCKPLD